MTDLLADASHTKITAALARSHLIRHDLLAMSLTPEARGLAKEIRSFLAALDSGMEGDDFLKDGNLVRWLPAILDFDQVANDRQERLRRLAASLARSSQRWSGRSLTWAYLVFLGFLVLSLFLFLCSTVLPVFDQMFKEFGLKLPAITIAVLWLGSWIGPQSHTIFLAITASYLMFRLGNRILRRVSHDRIMVTYWQRLCFGNSENLVGMSRFTHALACLLHVGVREHEAILIAGRASEHPVCLQNAIRMSSEVRTRPVTQCPTARCFPPLVIEVLREDGITRGDKRIGVSLLHEMSQIYSDRVRQRHEWMSEFLLPIALVFMGMTVGVIILALFLPLISLITSLT
jgi:type IV pilus assembly protein PilC